MIKSQCYNEITRNNQLINSYHNRINELNREIQELAESLDRLRIMTETLCTCKNHSTGSLEQVEKVSNINEKIINKFSNHMHNLLNGSEIIGILSGLNRGQDSICEEIQRRRNEINELTRRITDLENRNVQLNNTIAQINRREREEAMRKAAEEARKAVEGVMD